MVKVKFTQSPTGLFNLAYAAGDEGLVSKEMAVELIDRGYAIPLSEEKIEKAIAKPKSEKRTR